MPLKKSNTKTAASTAAGLKKASSASGKKKKNTSKKTTHAASPKRKKSTVKSVRSVQIITSEKVIETSVLPQTTEENEYCIAPQETHPDTFHLKSIWNDYIGCFKKYAQFGGRASQHEFTSFFIVNFIIVALLTALTATSPFVYLLPILSGSAVFTPFYGLIVPNMQMYLFSEMESSYSLFFVSLFLVYGLLSFIPAWSLAIRRAHDSGFNGIQFWGAFGAIILSLCNILSPLTFLTFNMLFMLYWLTDYLFLLFKKGNIGPNKYDTAPSNNWLKGIFIGIIGLMIYAPAIWMLVVELLTNNDNIRYFWPF